MANALILLAEGFEEIEAITVIDVLRRAEVDVTVAGVTSKDVMGAHGIGVRADGLLVDLVAAPLGNAVVEATRERTPAFDIVILPGGMPGSKHLRDDAKVRQLVIEQNEQQRLVAAICAAPIVLEAAGILNGRMATCFPGFELPSARLSQARVVVDGNVITSRGPGTALEFALTIVALLTEPERAARLRDSMLVLTSSS